MCPIAPNAGMIGEQTDPTPLEQMQRIRHQHLDSGPHRHAPGIGPGTASSPDPHHSQPKAYPEPVKHASSLTLIVLVAACASGTIRPAELQTQTVPEEGPISVAPRQRIVDSLLGVLTVREKVGQVIMPWQLANYTAFDGEAFEEAAHWIDEVGIGGLVTSIGSPLDAAAKLNALQERSKLPLLVAADLEYGGAMRMIGATAFPWAMAFGATGRELDAYQLGRITALEARAVGIHWTFSPVADLNNNPANPIINTRSFGEDPAEVSRLIAAYIRGVEEHGVYTTAKHFPGHGDTGVDSHIALPVVSACWDRLDGVELAPFRAAIAAGVTSVMTAHVALPCFDNGDDLPATLSPIVMHDILQDSLGFNGVIVTDALTMGAIVNEYGAGESAVRAFLAGSDLLLYPSDVEATARAMIDAVASGRISEARLDHSVRKLLELKERAGLFVRRTVALDSIPRIVGAKAHQAIADDIAARSLTLVTAGPIQSVRAGGSIAVIAYADASNQSIGVALTEELQREGRTARRFRLYPQSGPMSYDSAATVIAGANHVVFASGVRPISGLGHIALPDAMVEFIRQTDRTKSTVLVSFGSPYLLSQLPDFRGAFLLAWHTIARSQRAVARALAGRAPITGTLPITLSDRFARGHGIILR